MRKIATLTFQDADNYGAMLQCYALQKKIEELGYDCLVINYECRYLKKSFSKAALKRKGLVRFILGNINAVVRLPRKKAFKEFRSLIPMTNKVTKSTIKDLNGMFDVFIVGSDCVWNDEITNYDTTYLLDFVNDPDKKNSYASSFGFSDMNPAMVLNYMHYLKSFKSINVRETSGRTIVDKELGLKSSVVIDPTLLLRAEDWDKIIVDLEIKEKYIFVYQLTPSKYLISIVKKLKEQTNFKVVIIPFPIGGLFKADCHLSYGPREWVSLIKNAEYVVTDSFHGTAFSILYKKKVYCCVNKLATRIISLLELVGMNDCLYNDHREFQLIKDIDYDAVYEKLNTACKESLDILKRILQ